MKKTIIAILIVVALVAAGRFLVRSRGSAASNSASASAYSGNTAIVNGVQEITINARGGYSPRTTVARARVPSRIRVVTNGTYDCSTALSVPALQYRTILPPSGVTDIAVPAQSPGATLWGVCGMGMYNFSLKFE
jgi:plastocyanin domain-containing protein